MENTTSLLQNLKVIWWEWDHTLVEEGKMGLDISSGWEFPHVFVFGEMKKAMQMLWMQYWPWPKAREAAALGAKLD
ncbi:hypothetical protein F2Q69_00048303 [Brassica cretica]|uniref:Uncharacterized protein n=1 Tax=Brassica cretica TaxID=69181 RepID=A0A8S9PRH3_BRACR|nr:hypothetical protein F2Q69_00048303 [Brassica cretica]